VCVCLGQQVEVTFAWGTWAVLLALLVVIVFIVVVILIEVKVSLQGARQTLPLSLCRPQEMSGLHCYRCVARHCLCCSSRAALCSCCGCAALQQLCFTATAYPHDATTHASALLVRMQVQFLHSPPHPPSFPLTEDSCPLSACVVKSDRHKELQRYPATRSRDCCNTPKELLLPVITGSSKMLPRKILITI